VGQLNEFTAFGFRRSSREIISMTSDLLCRRRIARSKFFALAVALLGVLLILAGCFRTAAPIAQPTAEPTVGTVTIVIQLPDGEVRQDFDSVESGTTIADLMSKIESPEVTMIGSGDTAFVKSIGQLGTDAGKGWTFKVDGQWADSGVGAYRLDPPATVQWSHGSFDPSAE
jgi:hypothetical protein